jgi:hypothetical protein
MPASVLYVSYSGKADKENPVIATLQRHCMAPRFDLRLDKAQLEWGDAIRKFMDELARAPHLFLVLSDECFRSPYCMYELMRIFERGGGAVPDGVFPIIVEGAGFREGDGLAAIREHWSAAHSGLLKGFDVARPHKDRLLIDRLDWTAAYRDEVSSWIAALVDRVEVSPADVDQRLPALLERIHPLKGFVPQRPRPPLRRPDADFRRKVSKAVAAALTLKVFISYAREDEGQALRIYELLRSEGVTPWSGSASIRRPSWTNSRRGCGSSTSPRTRCDRHCTGSRSSKGRRLVTGYGQTNTPSTRNF